jgi:hypothetical protein
MDGDAIRSGALGQDGERDGIGFDATSGGRFRLAVAGLTDGGAVVDIDAEEDHGATQL